MLNRVLTIIHLFSAFGIIALVLVQRGRGAEAGAGFGSGASGTVFGARGARTALSRTTAVLAAIFMVTSLSLAYMVNRKSEPAQSVLDRLAAPPAGPTDAGSVPASPAPAQPVPVVPGAPAPGK